MAIEQPPKNVLLQLMWANGEVHTMGLVNALKQPSQPLYWRRPGELGWAVIPLKHERPRARATEKECPKNEV